MAYKTPTEATVHLVHSTGNANAGGGFTFSSRSSFVDGDGKIDFTKFMTGTGQPIATCSGYPLTADGGGITAKITGIPGGGEFSDVIVGTLVYCEFTGTAPPDDGVYVVSSVDVDGSNFWIDVDSSGFNGNESVDAYIGGAFPSISSALASDSTVCYSSTSGYYDRTILSSKSETPGSSLTFATGGKKDASVYRSLVHFNTDCFIIDGVIISDEDAGQSKHIMTTDGAAYGAMAMFRNDQFSVAVNGDYYGRIDADGGSIDVITLSQDCVQLRNWKIHNTNKSSENNCLHSTVTTNNHAFINCWFDSSYDYISGTIQVYDLKGCYLGTDMGSNSASIGSTSNGSFSDCVFNGDGRYYSLYFLNYCSVARCLFYGGTYGTLFVKTKHFENNIFFDQTTVCLRAASSSYWGVFRNNILSPLSANDYGIKTDALGGCISPATGNNIMYSVSADSVLDVPMYNNFTGSDHELFFPGTIHEDPKFVNPATGDFRLQSSSPALRAGFKDFFGEPTTIGVMNESSESVAVRARMSNFGRLSIFK
ncbi:MAG: hypothetical protein KAS23_05830 [Anaerohalosphaera sp.]|nr:hypothetical protein [Anaerohalosphaera sp.]